MAFLCYISSMKINEISDKELLKICRNYGRAALETRNKFIGVLPEVMARKLYEKKFVSIFHFAAVLGGVSREQVHRALHLSEKFQSMPHLLELLVNGVVSVNKLRRVLPIATIENEDELANLVQTLSRSALETFVRDVLIQQAQNIESQNVEIEIEDGLFKAQNEGIHGPGPVKQHVPVEVVEVKVQPFEYVSNPPLSNKIKKKLNDLAEKDIDINKLIEYALIRREQEIAQDKEILAQKAEQKVIAQITGEKRASTYISVATKRLLKKEHGTKCAIFGCRNNSQEIHHTNRFSISGDHNPYYMAPLCSNHHKIAHAVDSNVTQHWRF